MTKKVRLCPRCGSARISTNKTSVNGWLVPATYYCEEEGCGYSGALYVEVDAEELDAFKRAMNGDQPNKE